MPIVGTPSRFCHVFLAALCPWYTSLELPILFLLPGIRTVGGTERIPAVQRSHLDTIYTPELALLG